MAHSDTEESNEDAKHGKMLQRQSRISLKLNGYLWAHFCLLPICYHWIQDMIGFGFLEAQPMTYIHSVSLLPGMLLRQESERATDTQVGGRNGLELGKELLDSWHR